VRIFEAPPIYRPFYWPKSLIRYANALHRSGRVPDALREILVISATMNPANQSQRKRRPPPKPPQQRPWMTPTPCHRLIWATAPSPAPWVHPQLSMAPGRGQIRASGLEECLDKAIHCLLCNPTLRRACNPAR
jgi:hypothetical protein